MSNDFLQFREKRTRRKISDRKAGHEDGGECDVIKLKGRFVVKHFRDGVQIGEHVVENLVTNVAKNALFDTYFNQLTQQVSTNHFMGLIDSASWSTVAATDTMSSHVGWTESSAYTAATRPAWSQGAASGQAVTNPSPISFTMNASATIKGLFINSGATGNVKGGSAGTLWSAGQFSNGDAVVVASDVLQVTYTIAA